MSFRKSLVPAIAALLLIGAGCTSASPETDAAIDQLKEDSKTAAVAIKNEAVSVATTVALDDTWKTYVNKALSFEFRWPTKGRYAPQWEVTFASENDALIKGCLAGGPLTKRVKVGEAEFCHMWTEGESGPTDWYVTKHDTRYAVIKFTKPEGGEGFSLDEYRANLDQIVSTYKSTK